MTLKTLGMGVVKFLKTKKKKASSEAAGWGAHLKRRSRVFKENQKRLSLQARKRVGPPIKNQGSSLQA